VVSDEITKIVPVIQVGRRTQEMAYQVVHELKGRLRPGCVPVFSTDSLKQYFYSLKAHFGKWELLDGRKPIWVLFSNFVYAQVIKHQKRRRTVEVEQRILIGDGENYRTRLKTAGLSGRINTSFVEGINSLAPPSRAGVTIRQCVSKLTRRTWGPAYFTPELLEHLEYPGGTLVAGVLPFCSFSWKPGGTPVKPQAKKRETITHALSETDTIHGGRFNKSTLDGEGVIEFSFALISMNDGGGKVTKYSRRSDSRVSFAARQARKLQICGHFLFFSYTPWIMEASNF
jgi:hypothetical protein